MVGGVQWLDVYDVALSDQRLVMRLKRTVLGVAEVQDQVLAFVDQ
jgi:hypothetical protein